MDIIYKDFNILSENQVKNLYLDAGWTSYTENIKNTLSGIQNSNTVYSAWDNQQLVGLIRVISDGYTIAYIQDILVLKSYQLKGIGTVLMQKVLDKFKNLRQIVLLTDQLGPHNFYHKFGFEKAVKLETEAYVYFKHK